MSDMQTVSALENPELASAMAAAALADDTPVAPTMAPQPPGFVRLAGGLVRGLDAQDVSYEAEVRELNGDDEEYIERVRAGRPEKWMNAVLERGLVHVDGARADVSLVNSLLSGDGELLLMEIAKATYGEGLDYFGWVCPGCEERLDVTIDFDDIPVTRLDKTEDRFFDVPLRKGAVAHCRMLLMGDIADIAAAENEAEARTLILSKTVLSITDGSGNKQPVGDVSAARRIGVADRRTLIEAIANKRFGPAYNEVTFKHDSCGKESPFPIAPGDMFPEY